MGIGNRKILGTGLLLFIISFSTWSLILPQIFAEENTDNVLGAQIISPLADNWTPPKSSPSPTPIPTPSPSLKPTLQSSPKTTQSPQPTATPKPTAPPVTRTQIDEWITKYANQQSISAEELRKIADCESEFNPNAINAGYGGLYQFSKNTWISTRNSMNSNNDPDLRFDPEEAIKTAAFRLATEGNGAWPNCHL